MGVLLALIPAVCWGSIVLVTVKLGGDAHSQTLGTTWGALLFSGVTYLITQPAIDMKAVWVGFLSGMFWALGQRNQLASIKDLGVSKTVPLSTGMQLLATTLFGVLIFHEWQSRTTILLGSTAIVLIIVGVFVVSVQQDSQEDIEGDQRLRRGLMTLLISTLGYLGYVILIRWFHIDGWSAILPQATGMVTGATLLTFRHHPFNRYALRNILSGLLWGLGNLGLLLALPLAGVAISFSLSQTGIIISTVGGLFLLKEHPTKKRMILVIAGCLLIITGGVILGFTKAKS
ncbi:GRP family sugar transporter [Marinithermofilum abyssi]|uniref:GRP family sugar transporter n=1 Tax=Marinithermofilum abyssi TaxID=1571185 RepID=UPI001669220F|nr:GRP family sugar transporter [Marinithermofilum abyssi]